MHPFFVIRLKCLAFLFVLRYKRGDVNKSAATRCPIL